MNDLPEAARLLIHSALSPNAAARLLAEVRPAVALTRATPGAPVVGHPGGRPGVPRSGLLNVFYETTEQVGGFEPADRGAWRVLPADWMVLQCR